MDLKRKNIIRDDNNWQPQLSQNAPSSSPVAVETVMGDANVARGGGWVAVPAPHQSPVQWIVLFPVTSGGV